MTQWSWHRRSHRCRSASALLLVCQMSDHSVIVALSRYPDIDVEIFEGAEKLAELGAGIGLFPRMWISLNIVIIDYIVWFRPLGNHQEAQT